MVNPPRAIGGALQGLDQHFVVAVVGGDGDVSGNSNRAGEICQNDLGTIGQRRIHRLLDLLDQFLVVSDADSIAADARPDRSDFP
jgi:hypothetical protein